MFKLPESIKNGIEEYKQKLDGYLNGSIPEARFKGIRVPWGIYSHRGKKRYMSRVRIPAGILAPRQLASIAEASLKYGDGIIHITTRQDIQIHNVKVEDTAAIMEELKDYDLSPRGGGGNTVRNIIACPRAGICPEEVFDVREDAIWLSEFLLDREDSFNLPRKFKIAFSGCREDCVGCLVNDAGLFPVMRDGQSGYSLFAGGGLGAHSRVGRLLEEFVAREDIIYAVTAIKNVFYKNGNRQDKHHNRLRFLIEDLGFERFRELYYAELEEAKKIRFETEKRTLRYREDGKGSSVPPLRSDDNMFNIFLKYNVIPQKQRGFSAVTLRIPRGDLRSTDAIKIAALTSRFGDIEFRTTQNQNLMVAFVKNAELYEFYKDIAAILSGFLYPDTLLDIVACKGAATCNLGLCNSPGLAVELEKVVEHKFIGKRVFDMLSLKINGCPNACGHHPVGRIALHGMVRRVAGRPVPFYKVLLGGRKRLFDTRLAEEIGAVPGRNVPLFFEEFLEEAEKHIKGADLPEEDLTEREKDIARRLIERYAAVPAYNEDSSFYVDWGREDTFSLSGLGPGECGAGIIDMIDSDLKEAEAALERARAAAEISDIKKALFYAARALLVVRGVDPEDEKEAFLAFRKRFIEEGIASEAYSDIGEIYNTLETTAPEEEKKKALSYAAGFLEHIKGLYSSMDSGFNFPSDRKREGDKKTATSGRITLDLKGTPCPLNYVKAKLFLETLEPGATVEIYLDEGEPINNVPDSLKNDGHIISSIERTGDFYTLVVLKAGNK